MILFPPHYQDLSVSILLSHQHPDESLRNFAFSFECGIGRPESQRVPSSIRSVFLLQ
jgi:hypothetical protein